MGITAKELARKLGVSTTAVSFALNDKPGISEATRNRILDAAQAEGLVIGWEKTESKRGSLLFLSCVVHGAIIQENPFFTRMIGSAVQESRKHGYAMEAVHHFWKEDSREEFAYLAALVKNGIQGILLLGTEMSPEHFEPFRKLGVPIVVLDQYTENLGLDAVAINNIQGAYSACRRLTAAHRGQPGYLRSAYSIPNFAERSEGFFKAIRESGMSPALSVVHLLTPSIEGAYADMAAVIQSGLPLASCYFADNDLIAIGAGKAILDAGLRIPEDIGLIGFDNSHYAEIFSPGLSSVSVPVQVMGKLAVNRLLYRMSHRGEPCVRIAVDTSIVDRKSL